MNVNKVKAPLGMLTSNYYPITAEPAGTHPTYAASLDLGAAVKGYLTITTVTGEIIGDDTVQLETEQFVSCQADVETTMSDLEINAKMFGHTYSETDGEVSGGEDEPTLGAYTFVEPIIKKDKSRVFRATILFKTKPIASSEKQEADTRKPSEFNPKNNALSLKATMDNSGSWRQRKELDTLTAALNWIDTVLKPAAAS